MDIEKVLKSWLSVREVRRRYGYSANWVYDRLATGVICGYRVSGRWFVDPESLKDFERRPRRWKKRSGQQTNDIPAIGIIDNAIRDLVRTKRD